MQLKEVLDAFMERDADHALKVWYKDESIDSTYNSVFRELLTYMMEDPQNIGLCTHLLSGLRTSSGSATTRPISPRSYICWFMAHRSTTNGRRLTPRTYPLLP